jgi:3-(3-hydroxy-phenyl)propionate hydroxylase
LTLPVELSFASIDMAIVERRVGRRSKSRAQEVCTCVRSRFSTNVASPIDSHPKPRGTSFGHNFLDISDLPTGLALWQKHIERLLAGWVDELTLPVDRGCDVIAPSGQLNVQSNSY